MSVTWTAGYAATSPYPMTHARILYTPASGSATASSEVEGYEAALALNPDTYSYWLPSATPATWAVDFGSPKAVDAVGIAAHSLAGQTVAVDTWNGTAWVEQVPAFAVTDNGPLLVLFAEVTTDKVQIRVDGIPQPVGVIYAGKALVMPQKSYVGLGQINLKRRTEYKINQTEGGLWAGRSIARVSLIAAYQWTHLTDAFYLANVEPFSFSARQYPFFLAARPSGYPEETTYAWVAADIAPERMGVLDFCSVGFEAIGYSRA